MNIVFGIGRDTDAEVRAGLQKIYPRIWRYALTLTGARDRADDLAQAACLRAIERQSQYEPGTKLDRWVFRITHNLWISEIRRDKVRTGNGLVGIELTEITDPSQTAEHKMQHKELMQSILHLPEAQRQTVYLVYVEGYLYKDAAAILNIPIGTVMSRLAAARSTLTKQLRGTKDSEHAG